MHVSIYHERYLFIAPARSAGASYSETGVSNDQVSVRSFVLGVRKKRAKHRMVSAPAGFKARNHSGYFSVDFQGAEEKCVCAVKE